MIDQLFLNLPAQFKGAPNIDLNTIFERIVTQYPDRIAVTSGNEQITYKQLNDRATHLAIKLQDAGVSRDQLIGLCLKRGIDLIVGMLGIIKSNAAYVPIDPNYSSERNNQILKDSNIKMVVTSSAVAEKVNAYSTIFIDDLSSEDAQKLPAKLQQDGSNLAYVIFTSGSTGQPKGVMVEHKNVVRLFTATHHLFNFSETDTWCNFHSIAFDFSVWEIWGALLFGGRLVIVSDELSKSPETFYRFLQQEKITVLNQTPSSFRNIIAASIKQPHAHTNLRYVIFGGERLDCHMLSPWIVQHGFENPKLINMYGITETTVHVSWKQITEIDLLREGISPIGKPISDLKIDIVDESGKILPIGKEGIMYIGGAGLARGYLNRPDLTKERFVYRTNKQGDNELWYNSGDVGVQINTDEYGYVGRADNQLKVRGFRIEPKEIEITIKQCPEVLDCIVSAVDYDIDDTRLVAYLVLKNSESEASEALIKAIRDLVNRKLPNYMWPSSYLILKKFPLTANGKLDRTALPKPQASLAFVANNSTDLSIEENLCSIWKEILQINNISSTEDFFDIGGTSFSLIRMLRIVNDTYGTDIRPDVLSSGANITVLVKAIQMQLVSEVN